MSIFLTQHFTLAEFTASETATRHGIDNSLPPELMEAARETARMMERIRDYLKHLSGRDIPIHVSSAWRCLPLNRVLKSGDSSHHPLMGAVDWLAPAFGTPTEVCTALASQVRNLGIGQLINEYPDADGWVHTSRLAVSNPVNRIITIRRGRPTVPGIHGA